MTERELQRLRSSRDKIRFERNVALASERSPFVWATSYIALPKGEVWSFDDMRWQIGILNDLHPSIVSMKPTQVGMTLLSSLKTLWFVSYVKSRAMYTLPRRDDVLDYVAATIDPIIEGSEFLSTRVGRTNTQRMKRIGDSFFHVMEASVTPRMLPVDILVNDEVDLSDQDNLEQFVARLDRSKYKYHYRFSTPTVSGFGIDAEYGRSDMREWVVTCSRCNHTLVLDWEVHLVRDWDPPYYQCDKCKQQLRLEDIVGGEWVAQSPGVDIHGYHISHMMLPLTRPLTALLEEEAVMDTRTFYNLRLGKPWRPTGGSMAPTLFRDVAFQSGHAMQVHKDREHTYYLGADQGNDVHVVVARTKGGENRLEVVYAEHIKGGQGLDQFDRLVAIMRMFDIDFGMMDANPNRAIAYSICNDFHGHMAAADIGEFNYPFRWHGFTGDAAYRVTVSRSDLLDGLRDDVSNGKIMLWGSWDGRDKVLRDIIEHCGNLKRDIAKRKLRSGGEKVVSIWRRVGEDHFAFALALARLAWVVAPTKSTFSFVEIGSDSAGSSTPGRKMKKSKVWEGLVYDEEADIQRRPIIY